jgi:hypothetical protein
VPLSSDKEPPLAEPQSRSTQCTVEIVTPQGVRIYSSPTDTVRDLLQVQTDNDMSQAAGTFRLSFAPRTIDGRTYDQVIPLGSLVTIKTQDAERPVGENARVILLGRTEDHAIQEEMTRAGPRRSITISGRSMAGLLLDATMFYHPGLEQQGVGLRTHEQFFNLQWPTVLTQPNLDPRDGIGLVLHYFLGLPTRQPLPGQPGRLETSLAVQQEQTQIQAKQPTLTAPKAEQNAQESVQRSHPVKRVKGPAPPAPVATRTNVEVLQQQAQIAQLRKANPTLSAREAALQVADAQEKGGVVAPVQTQPLPVVQAPAPAAQVRPKPAPAPPAPVQAPHVPLVRGGGQLINLQLPGRTVADVLDLNNDQWNVFEEGITVLKAVNTPFAHSLWNFLQIFVDPLFQEFFTRMEGGVVKIHFRSKPFLKEKIMAGTRFRSDDPTCPTIVLDPKDLLASHLRRQSAHVYNVFIVRPGQDTTQMNEAGALYSIFPVALSDSDHPSYVRRHGLRVLHHRSPYLSGLLTVPGTPQKQQWEPVIETSKRWAAIASHWYGYAPELYAGILTVRGSPRYNCGMRLLMRDARGEREGYIEGVGHSYDYRTGHYVTQLRVTRMWYLDGPIDERGTLDVETLPSSAAPEEEN